MEFSSISIFSLSVPLIIKTASCNPSLFKSPLISSNKVKPSVKKSAAFILVESASSLIIDGMSLFLIVSFSAVLLDFLHPVVVRMKPNIRLRIIPFFIFYF